VNVMFLIKELL